MTREGWQPIATAPDHLRILVAGVQPKSKGGTKAYWWWHEDCCEDGKSISHPDATHWCAVDIPEWPHSAQQALL
jgi:hypothetical protein